MLSWPHSSSLRKSSPGFSAVSRQSSGRSRTSTSSSHSSISRRSAMYRAKSWNRRSPPSEGEDAETCARARESASSVAHRAARPDGTGGNPVVVGVGEDHVLVPVVLLWCVADLCPLPAEECHGVRIGGIARDLVALAERLHGLSPVAWSDALGVVVDGPEVECRAVAGEVTGVRRRVSAFALGDGQAHQEGVEGEGGVNVEVAEEDLLRLGDSDALGSGALGDCTARYHRQRSVAPRSPRRAPHGLQTTRALR